LFAFPSIFFDLIGRSSNETRGYQFRSVEIKQTAFRINGVFLPPESSPDKTVYFCEVQFQKDEFLYHRVFAELFLFASGWECLPRGSASLTKRQSRNESAFPGSTWKRDCQRVVA
jgi:hypothetical protein